jgi:hypothetical protein
MRALLVAALASFTFATEGSTAPLPQYQVEKWCDDVAASTGPRSEVAYAGCIDLEQKAYDEMKTRWATMPAQRQKWCDEVARSTGNGSYLSLFGCAEQEERAAEQNAQRRFKR